MLRRLRVLAGLLGAVTLGPSTLAGCDALDTSPDVTLSVSGSGSALVTYGVGGRQEQTTTALPWSKTEGVRAGTVVALVAQRQSGTAGSITVRIKVAGRDAEESTSSGPYAVASLSTSVD